MYDGIEGDDIHGRPSGIISRRIRERMHRHQWRSKITAAGR